MGILYCDNVQIQSIWKQNVTLLTKLRHFEVSLQYFRDLTSLKGTHTHIHSIEVNILVDKLNKPTTGQNIDNLIQELPGSL
jgi:hypothetical protein